MGTKPVLNLTLLPDFPPLFISEFPFLVLVTCIELSYSGTPLDGHPLDTDTRL